MRVASWTADINKELIDLFNRATTKDFDHAAEYLAGQIRNKTPVGTISRPIYRKGPYAGEPWTARDAGQLRKSVRVTRRRAVAGETTLLQAADVRVYIGHYLAWYAAIVEFTKPFVRPTFYASLPRVKQILGLG